MAVQEPSSKEVQIINLTVKDADDLVKSYNIDDKNIRKIWMPTNDEETQNFTYTYLEHLTDCQKEYIQGQVPGGFDHRKIIKQFMSNAAKLPVEEDEVMHTYTTPEGKEYKLYSSNDPTTDLLFFINLFVQNGGRCFWDLQSDLGILLEKKKFFYDILFTNEMLVDSGLILDRVCQAFAGITAKVIMDEKINGGLESKFFQSIEMPLIMTHYNILPGLLRESDHELIDIAIYLNIEIAIKCDAELVKYGYLHRFRDLTLGELFELAKPFVYSAIGTNIMDETTQKAFLMKVGLIDESDKLTNAVRAIYSIARQLNALHRKKYSEVIPLMVIPTIHYKQQISPSQQF